MICPFFPSYSDSGSLTFVCQGKSPVGLSVALGIFLCSACQSREHRLLSVLWAAQGEPGGLVVVT